MNPTKNPLNTPPRTSQPAQAPVVTPITIRSPAPYHLARLLEQVPSKELKKLEGRVQPTSVILSQTPEKVAQAVKNHWELLANGKTVEFHGFEGVRQGDEIVCTKNGRETHRLGFHKVRDSSDPARLYPIKGDNIVSFSGKELELAREHKRQKLEGKKIPSLDQRLRELAETRSIPKPVADLEFGGRHSGPSLNDHSESPKFQACDRFWHTSAASSTSLISLGENDAARASVSTEDAETLLGGHIERNAPDGDV